MNYQEPRKFKLIRLDDESGVSGTGHVLDGIVWHNGKVTVCWCSPTSASSIVIYDNFQDFWDIHLHPHPTNKSKIEWEDGTIQEDVRDETIHEGDKVQVNSNAFDEQLEHMQNTLQVYTVKEILNSEFGPMVYLEEPIIMIDNNSGEEIPYIDFLNIAWLHKI